MAWSNLINALFLVGKPITSSQGLALRDNVISARKAEDGAPYEVTSWHPHDGVNIGDGVTGEIWSFASDGVVSTITTPDFADDHEYRLRLVGVGSASGTHTLRLSASSQASGTYYTTLDIVGIFSNQPSYGYIELIRPRVLGFGVTVEASIALSVFSSAIQVSTSPDVTKDVRLSLSSGGTFGEGAIYMDKRRVYA